MKASIKLKAFQNILLDQEKNELTAEDRKEWIIELKRTYSWAELSELLKVPKPTLRKWQYPSQNQNESRVRNPYDIKKIIDYFEAYRYHPRDYKHIRRLIDVLEHLIGLNQLEDVV